MPSFKQNAHSVELIFLCEYFRKKKCVKDFHCNKKIYSYFGIFALSGRFKAP